MTLDQGLITSSVLEEVLNEREHQVYKWGGIFDDTEYSYQDWADMIQRYNFRALDAADVRGDECRRRYIQVAALAVAAVEALDRKASNALGT